eukprot:EG_transcript_5081
MSEPPKLKYKGTTNTAGDGANLLWGVPVPAPDALARRQVYMQHALFVAVQRLVRAAATPTELNKGLVKLSQQYRAALQEDGLLLRRLHATSPSATEAKRREEQRLERAVWEAVWHLAEILLVDDGPAVGPLFVAWVAHHCPQPSLKKLQATEPSRMHQVPEYWPVIQTLLCTGQTTEALRLLESYMGLCEQDIRIDPRITSEEREEDLGAFNNLRVLLESKPSLLHTDPQQFKLRFDQWQADCDECREYCVRVFHKCSALPLMDIMNLLCGDEKTLKGHCRTWYELVAAYIEFVCPEVSRTRMEDLAVKCMCEKFRIVEEGMDPAEVMLDAGEVSNLDKVFLMIISGRTVELMQACDQLFPEGFNAPLADLLLHRGRVSREAIPPLDVDAREYFLLRYATTLAAEEEYWNVALDYFAQCPVQGGDHLVMLLDHMDFADETKAERVFAQLEAMAVSGLHQLSPTDLQHLHSVMMNVHRTLGRSHAADQQYVTGVMHFLKGQSYSDLQRLAEEVVEGFTRSFINDYSLISASGTSTRVMMPDTHYQEVLQTISELVETGSLPVPAGGNYAVETLLCLHKLWKAHQAMHQRDFKAAARDLMALIENNALPRRLWVLLLVQAIPLCERQAFSTQEVFQLMARLEELLLSHKAAEYRKGISDRMLGNVRLALVNNLRQGFIAAAASTAPLPALPA